MKLTIKRLGDWWPCFGADTSEADVLRLAAKALEVPEKRVEVLETADGWLARERKENLVNDNVNPVVSEAQTVAFAP